MEKRQPLQQVFLNKLVICIQKTETRSMFFTHTCTNSKWIKDLNIRPESLKTVQERAGNTLELIDINNNFQNRTQMAQQVRERINKWDYMKLNSFCTTEEMVTKLKRLPTGWGKCSLVLPAIHLTMDYYPESSGNSKN
jgi:hypothetical protein